MNTKTGNLSGAYVSLSLLSFKITRNGYVYE